MHVRLDANGNVVVDYVAYLFRFVGWAIGGRKEIYGVPAAATGGGAAAEASYPPCDGFVYFL